MSLAVCFDCCSRRLVVCRTRRSSRPVKFSGTFTAHVFARMRGKNGTCKIPLFLNRQCERTAQCTTAHMEGSFPSSSRFVFYSLLSIPTLIPNSHFTLISHFEFRSSPQVLTSAPHLSSSPQLLTSDPHLSSSPQLLTSPQASSFLQSLLKKLPSVAVSHSRLLSTDYTNFPK